MAHLVMIEAQEALAVQTETESQEEMAVVNIVMVTGFAQNVAIKILHGGKNVIAVMRQSPMMEIVEEDQEIQVEVEGVLEVADQTEVKAEIFHVGACEEVKDQEVVEEAVLIVNVHINFQIL